MDDFNFTTNASMEVEVDEPPSSQFTINYNDALAIIDSISLTTNLLTLTAILLTKDLKKDLMFVTILLVNLVQIIAVILDYIILLNQGNFEAIFTLGQASNIVTINILLLNALLLVQWYFKLHVNEIQYKKFCKIPKFVYLFILLLDVPFLIVDLFLLSKLDRYLIGTTIVCILHVIVIVFMSILGGLNSLKSRATLDRGSENVGLVVAGIDIVCSAPATIINVMLNLGIIVSLVLPFLSTLLWVSSPIYSFFYLCKFDDDFNTFFRRLLRCEFRRRRRTSRTPVIYAFVHK